MRPLTFGLPLVMAGAMFIGPSASMGWSPDSVGFFAAVALILGTGMFLMNWYVVPRFNSVLVSNVREFNSQPFGQCEVCVSPDGIGWTAVGLAETFQPWGAVWSVDTLKGGISIRLGRPSVIFWIPARAFPSDEDLRDVGALAQSYFTQADRLPSEDVQWPFTSRQRKANIIGGVLWAWPFLLVLAIAAFYHW